MLAIIKMEVTVSCALESQLNQWLVMLQVAQHLVMAQ